MGGDDSRVYIFYPTQFLNNVSNNLRFSFLETENNQAFYVNTIKVLSLLEKVGFNYLDFYFLFFYLGFIFFFLSLKEIKIKLNFNSPLVNYFILFIALLYPTNPLIVDQVWNNHWTSIFSIIGAPLIFFIFLKIIFNRISIIEIIFLNLIMTSLSLYFGSIIPPIGLSMTLTMGLIIFLILNKKEMFSILKKIILFLIIFVITNSYWIYTLLHIYSASTGSSESDTQAYLVNLNNAMNYYSKEINNFYLIMLHGVNVNSNFDLLYFFSLIFFWIVFFICLASLITKILKKEIKLEKTNLIIPFGFSLIVAMFLQSIALTPIGKKIFLFLATNFVFLAGFRNYINKVPTTYSLFILTLIFLLVLYAYKQSKALKISLLLAISLFSLVSFRNLILLEDYKLNLPQGYVRNTSFSSDTWDLFSFIKKNKDIERVAFIPLSTATYGVYKNGNQLYIGNSPITIFTGVDDYNGFWYSEQVDKVFYPFQNSFLESFKSDSINNFMNHLNLVNADTVVLNNTVDPDSTDYGFYFKTGNYKNLVSLIRNNLNLVYETPNKEFSVYRLKNRIISFKDKVYNIPAQLSYENFQMLDYTKETFISNSLDKKYINFDLINFSSQPISDIKNLDKVYDSKQNLVTMSQKNLIFLNENKDSAIILLQNNKDNIIRIVVDSPEDILSVKFGVEDRGSSCALKIFSASYCRILRNPVVQKVENSYSYTIDLIYPTNITFAYLKVKKPDTNVRNLNIRAYTGSNYKSEFNNIEFTKEEKQKLISSLFVNNQDSYNYQIPQEINIQKIDKDSYRIQAKLNNQNQPLILTLSKIYNPKWNLKGNGIESSIHFQANAIFNGWAIKPNSTNLDLILSFDEYPISLKLKQLNEYSILGSIIFLAITSIYAVIKILIRKFWR